VNGLLVREIRVTAATGKQILNCQSAQGSGAQGVIDLRIRITLTRALSESVLHLTTVDSKSMFSSLKKDSPPNSQSPQDKQQSQPSSIYPWSARTPPFASGPSPSPFPRYAHTLSTSVTSAGELFLFGGFLHRSLSPSNDLYVISTRDFSTTPFKTSGNAPNPRYGHCAVLTSDFLLIWGGMKNFREKTPDDSLYFLNLGTSDLFDVKSYSS